MITISSKNNPVVVETKKLYNKKYRKLNNQCIIEGEKLIREAINSGVKLNKIFSTNEKLLADFNENVSQLYLVTSSIIKELSSTISPQNIIAVIDTNYQYVSKSNCILILDNLQNPDNYGAIIRSAVATNFNKILAINCVDKFNEKVIRASMGTIFRCEIIETDYQQIEKLSGNYTLFYADMGGKSIFNFDVKNDKIGFVVGNEGNGVSDEIKKLVKNKVSIPMENNVESLNATVAGSVIMYQIYSKLLKIK